jgi:hypothetical protein
MNDKAETTTNFELTPHVEIQAIAVTPMHMLAAAMERGIDTDQLDKLMELQERYEKNEARKAYYAAIAAAAVDMPVVTKDKLNTQYDSFYPSLENTINTISTHLAQFELSARWEVDQSAGIRVTCILSHVAGHSENVTLTGPPDMSGKKNELQQIKSTLTYLKLATFEAITGTASMVGNLDDDGNGAGSPEPIAPREPQPKATKKQLATLQEYVDAGGLNKRQLAYIEKNKDTMTKFDAFEIINRIKAERAE